MKKYTVLSVLALACCSMKAAELDGTGFAGYTTNTVSQGFSIVAVPFSGFDTNSFTFTNLSLNALILTNGLSIGDRLIAFDETSQNYSYYSLTSTNWNPLQVTDVAPDTTNRVVNALPLSGFTKAQGYAFWLKTQSATTTVYLQGAVNTNASVAVASGFSLIGNALPTPLQLNDSSFTNANPWFTAGPPGFGDEIHAVVGTNYVKNVYINSRWKQVEYPSTGAVFTNDAAIIPAGTGVWFKRIGTTRNLILK
ncbi:MAG: hypothetical protein WCP12_07745 [bacterium]